MKIFRNLSIKNKLLMIILSVTLFSIVIGFTIDIIQDYLNHKEKLINESMLNAKLVSEYCIAPMDFGYYEEAEKSLSKLATIPSIYNGYVYDVSGNLFAVYNRNEEITPPPIPVNDIYNNFDHKWLHIFRPIQYHNEKIGTIYLRVSTTELYNSLKTKIISIIIIGIGIMILVFFLAIKMQSLISQPILKLANFTEKISKEKNYSVRIKKEGTHEIGTLYDNFNIMLEKIHLGEKQRDIAEVELKHLQNYLTNIIDSMPSILIGVDVEGKVTQWNKTAEKNIGISKTEAQGKNISNVIPEMSLKMNKIIESIQTREVKYYPKEIRSIENDICYEDITIYPLVTSGVQGAVIRIDDVTDKVRMIEMMIQSEKMMSVGGLAAGMAHEINNPLAGIMQNIQVIENRLFQKIPKNVSIAKECNVSIETIINYMKKRKIDIMLQSVHQSGERASHIVQNMLSFSRKSENNNILNDITKIIDNTLDLTSNDYDLKKKYDFRKIKIIKDYQKNLPNVVCEFSKIQQVLLNLFKNGAQAMSAENGITNNPQFIIQVKQIDNMLQIEIEDNGPGMSKEIQNRVFEPFFTTKDVGSGTGLGLSVSYFIITDNHKGEMYVESEVGKGTKFTIKLPIS